MPEDDNIEIDRIKAKNATVINEDSMQMTQNTVTMNENKNECNNNKEISDLIMSYIGNGGDLESLKRFLNK